MRYSIYILLCVFYITVPWHIYSQKPGIDYISAAELNQHLSKILEDKGLLDDLLTVDHHGETAVFVIMDIYPSFAQFNPYENNGYKTYFWNTEDVFFYNINPPIFKIHSYEKGQLEDVIEFVYEIKESYRIRFAVKHHYFSNGMKSLIPPEIESVQITKIKWKDL
jgi:hypothetical protein